MRPRCPSVGPFGLRCRKRLHGPVPADPLPPLNICHTAYGWEGVDYWDDETAAERPVQHVSIGDGEIVWDVNALNAIAAERKARSIRVASFVEPEAVNRRHSYWRTVDVHTPVILIPHPTHGQATLIDGRHRVYKAWKEGREFVPAVQLTRADEQRCRLTPDEVERIDRMHAAAQAMFGRVT